VEESDAAAKDDEDDEGLNVRHTDADASRPTVAPRWPTRVFAIECMRRVMAVCGSDENHFSLATAKALRQSGKGQNYFIICSKTQSCSQLSVMTMIVIALRQNEKILACSNIVQGGAE